MKVLICILFFKVALAQMNGDFWWLNDKFVKLKGLNVKDVEYEEDRDSDKDESDKIVFFDDNVPNYVTTTAKYFNKNVKITPNKATADIKWPNDMENYLNIDNGNPNEIAKHGIISDVKFERLSMTSESNRAIYPDDGIVFRSATEKASKYKICSYITKTDCTRSDGFVYLRKTQQSESKNTLTDSLVCCIVPLSQKAKRFKRSKDKVDINTALKQRKILILRRQNPNNRTKPTPVSTQRFDPTITPEDDYIDPYWNIKNTFEKPNTNTHTKYINQDNEEGYLTEIPRPLIASEHPPTDWSIYKGSNDYYDEVEEEKFFGYGRLDPRRAAEKLIQRGKPSKSTPSTIEHLSVVDNPTIIYHSSPDFKVLQGFKLLFLVPNVTKNGIIEKLPTERGKEIDRRNILIQPLESQTYLDRDQKNIYKLNHANYHDERKPATSEEISGYNK